LPLKPGRNKHVTSQISKKYLHLYISHLIASNAKVKGSGSLTIKDLRLLVKHLPIRSDQDVQIMYKWINRYLFIPIYGYKNMERTLTTAEKTSQLMVRINGTRDLASKNGYPEKYGWWISELNSLGVNTEAKNEVLGDVQALENLTDETKNKTSFMNTKPVIMKIKSLSMLICCGYI
jgi:hypothetical protein